jgi:hypothetical protein
MSLLDSLLYIFAKQVSLITTKTKKNPPGSLFPRLFARQEWQVSEVSDEGKRKSPLSPRPNFMPPKWR